MINKLISMGAEASIFSDEEKIVRKSRLPKSYRHTLIDEQLRKRRTKAESKLLIKAKEVGVSVPQVLTAEKYDLTIEFIKGDRLSETLHSYSENKQFEIMKKLGGQIALLHKEDIIHGDLTTSNIILNNKEVFIIDFGLGFISKKLEDRAVDLHLLKQALEAKHFQNHEKLFEEFLEGYALEEKNKVLERLRAVERRGRYRH